MTPAHAAKLRILDPACGSGSFLIGAYHSLLDWHLRWYLAHDPDEHCKGKHPPLMRLVREVDTSEPERVAPALSGSTRSGSRAALDYRLTTHTRKTILLNSIYGVDIDPQAVEVTKLSLLLKVLEGESQETIAAQLRLFHARALPDLGDNIKCGNSLIGPDFYDDPKNMALDDEERRRINVFDWQREFPEVFKAGGFDTVIGNPPYVNAWDLYASNPVVRDYINDHAGYRSADRHWDLYVVFLERALQIVRQGGRVSLIIPFAYAIQKYGQRSRSIILTETHIESVADLRTVRVFGGVPVITIIPVVVKEPSSPEAVVLIRRPGEGATKYHAGRISDSHTIKQSRFLEQHEQMLRLDLSDAAFELCRRVERESVTVGDIAWVNYGAQMSSRKKGGFGKEYVIRAQKETATCRPMISGRELYRYSIHWEGRYVEWALADQMYGPRHQYFFERPKAMIRDITGTHRLEVAADDSGLYCDHTILCAQLATVASSWREFGPEVLDRAKQYSLPLVQGLLASRLVSAYCYLILTGEGIRIGGGFHTYPQTIRRLPLLDLENCTDLQRKITVRVASLAERMLDLHKRHAATRNPDDAVRLQREIDATDRQIDQLVYELYGLSAEEIRIVEEATGEGQTGG